MCYPVHRFECAALEYTLSNHPPPFTTSLVPATRRDPNETSSSLLDQSMRVSACQTSFFIHPSQSTPFATPSISLRLPGIRYEVGGKRVALFLSANLWWLFLCNWLLSSHLRGRWLVLIAYHHELWTSFLDVWDGDFECDLWRLDGGWLFVESGLSIWTWWFSTLLVSRSFRIGGIIGVRTRVGSLLDRGWVFGGCDDDFQRSWYRRAFELGIIGVDFLLDRDRALYNIFDGNYTNWRRILWCVPVFNNPCFRTFPHLGRGRRDGFFVAFSFWCFYINANLIILAMSERKVFTEKIFRDYDDIII